MKEIIESNLHCYAVFDNANLHADRVKLNHQSFTKPLDWREIREEGEFIHYDFTIDEYYIVVQDSSIVTNDIIEVANAMLKYELKKRI